MKVLMTTRNRLDLLRRTVESLAKSDRCPEGICVYDDASDDPKVIAKIISDLPKSNIITRPTKVGCDMNTPLGIKSLFESDKDLDFVLVIDSDVIVSKHWMDHVDRCIETMKSDSSIAMIQILNLENIKMKTPSSKYSDMMDCKTLSACGMIVSRQYWKSYILPYENNGYYRWDMNSAEKAYSVGQKLYCLKESAIQHIGDQDGVHKGAGQVASFFRADVPNIVAPGTAQMGRVMVFPGYGYRSLVVGMMTAEILVAMGSKVRLFCQDLEISRLIEMQCCKRYRSLHRANSFPLVHGRYNATTSRLRTVLNGYSPINMELESDDNRWLIYSLDNNIEEFVRWKLIREFGVSPDDIPPFDWSTLHIKNLPHYKWVRELSGCVVVNNLEGDAETLSGFINSDNLHPLLLVEKIPQVGISKARDGYIYNLKPLQMISVIQQVGEFVSISNQSAYVSLFCDVNRRVFDDGEFGSIPFPEELLLTAEDKLPDLPSLAIVAEGYSRDELCVTSDAIHVVDKLADVADLEVEWVIRITGNVKGFYSGWISDLLQDRDSPRRAIIHRSGPDDFVIAWSGQDRPRSYSKYSESRCRLIGEKEE